MPLQSIKQQLDNLRAYCKLECHLLYFLLCGSKSSIIVEASQVFLPIWSMLSSTSLYRYMYHCTSWRLPLSRPDTFCVSFVFPKKPFAQNAPWRRIEKHSLELSLFGPTAGIVYLVQRFDCSSSQLDVSNPWCRMRCGLLLRTGRYRTRLTNLQTVAWRIAAFRLSPSAGDGHCFRSDIGLTQRSR